MSEARQPSPIAQKAAANIMLVYATYLAMGIEATERAIAAEVQRVMDDNREWKLDGAAQPRTATEVSKTFDEQFQAVPHRILDCARDVERYFKQQGVHHWELMGIRSREVGQIAGPRESTEQARSVCLFANEIVAVLAYQPDIPEQHKQGLCESMHNLFRAFNFKPPTVKPE